MTSPQQAKPHPGPTSSPTPTQKVKHLLDRAKPAEDLAKAWTKSNFLFIGNSGTGKTSLFGTCPGRLLFLDLDQRADALAGNPKADIITLGEADPKSAKAWQQLDQLRKEIWIQIRQKTFPYDAVFIDSLTTMNRAAMNWSLTLNPNRGFGGGPLEAHYGPHGNAISQFLMSMTALPITFGVSCHFNIVEDTKQGIFKYLPKVWGKMLRTEVPTFFSEVWFTRKTEPASGKKAKYLIYTSHSPHFGSCKSAINFQGDFWTDPQEFDLSETPCGIEKLINLRFGEKEK